MISRPEVIKRLKANGWEHVATRGDYHQFKKGRVKVIVQHPVKGLSLRNI